MGKGGAQEGNVREVLGARLGGMESLLCSLCFSQKPHGNFQGFYTVGKGYLTRSDLYFQKIIMACKMNSGLTRRPGAFMMKEKQDGGCLDGRNDGDREF